MNVWWLINSLVGSVNFISEDNETINLIEQESRRYLLPIVSGATKACDEVGKKSTDLAEIDDHER